MTSASSATGEHDRTDRTPGERSGPLGGITVTDFGWMGVGSLASRLLADFGARVIRIEDRNRLDMPRRLPFYKGAGLRSYGEELANPDPDMGGCFNNYNRNKLGITVNMSEPDGRELVERLIAISSVLSENFAPGVMEKWGLTESRVRELSPEIIYARMSGFGHSGPYADYRSWGPVVQAVCGLSGISGEPDREPSGWGLSYMDNQAAYYNSVGILMALFARNRGAGGCDLDVSAVEAGVELLGPTLLNAGVNTRPVRGSTFRTGNRLEHPAAAPHGVYPSAGTDKWVAIAVFGDAEWERLVEALGRPEWACRAEFAGQKARLDHQDELDAHLSAWTLDRTCHAAMETLQAAGVRAAAVQTAEDINETDPQIAFRGAFFELDHPVIGPARFEGIPFTSATIRPDHWRSGPLLGEDVGYVLGELLGMSESEIQDLRDREVI
jgi:crotonobetainyl-CoA:carnitine CoA-transferase CaiB-like acyl-CoA transferase